MSIPQPKDSFYVPAFNGGRLSVRRYGYTDGPRVVLTHGNGFSADAYYPFWKHLAEDFDLFIYDIRNHGLSSKTDIHDHHIIQFSRDAVHIARDIDRRFGCKPRVSVSHSISCVIDLYAIDAGYAGLVLFDAPISCPERGRFKMVDCMNIMQRKTSRRRSAFEHPAGLARTMARIPAFSRIDHDLLNVLARSLLRRSKDGMYVLRCPREFEAKIFGQVCSWIASIDLQQTRCPIKAIGADPVFSDSFLPSFSLIDLIAVDYDFIPDTSHFLMLERPQECREEVRSFCEAQVEAA